MNAAEIHGQAAVHEQEQIVVASKGEDLAALVREADVDLGREILVVVQVLVPPPFVVSERIERVAVKDPDTGAHRIGRQRDALLEVMLMPGTSRYH